ncbi:MAG: inositol polyphosphate 5-phosphatase [Claussenomyces sp. TS43310]|nr:MAG: inositol polyphosphate 5-phosphatase [Claussenomyces sp. TS43310]
MSIRILLRDQPNRAIALVTSTHALIFRHSPSTVAADADRVRSLTSLPSIQSRTSIDLQSPPRCMVAFTDLDSVDIDDYRTVSPLPVRGTLGLITINSYVFLCVVTGSTKVATVRPGETVEKILGVEFHCLNSADFDIHALNNDFDPYAADYGQNAGRREAPMEHPCTELQKLLGNGSFYYSTDFDLTNRLQDRSVFAKYSMIMSDFPPRSTPASTFDADHLDDSYLWNSYMIKPLVKFRSQLLAHKREALDASRILTSAIRGFVLTMTIPISSSPIQTTKTGLPSTLTLVSRLSCRRAGTRFNSRGIDDDGNVANSVESETIYWSPSGLCFSYAQVRGSVPVFWEQAPGLIPGQQKITITRSKEGTQPAFDKHFQDLEQAYGAIHVINLLSESKPGEAELTALYRHGVRHSSLNQVGGKHLQDHQLLQETEFDFHAETKENGYEAASMIRHLIEHSADGFAYYLAEESDDPPISSDKHGHGGRSVVVLQQEGVFRTNCLDCLDRTNLIQTIISQMAIESFLSHRSERARSDFWMRHSSLWADNGDALSRIYAGTGALKSSFTRSGKMSFAGAIADARKSATRLYINNFADKNRQNTMDILLGRLVGQAPVYLYDPINEYVNAEVNKRSADYSSSKTIKLWVGSFNLNGRTNGIEEDLSAWLCPRSDPDQQPDIVAVGFQEIVELSPQQIMNSDPSRKQDWEKAVKKTLNSHARKIGSENYVLLRSGQLVGAALCIFVRASALRDIKNVEGSVKKTGLSGMAGNKGAVAIRMDYANTQICFVTAHLAAGFANYDERNKDYHTIHHGLRFQRDRSIDDHDAVIFFGDFNYRIGMSAERVKSLLNAGQLEMLYENDQLNIQMVAGLTFPHYSEARITFMPTYKFDLGNDRYDTSEKARIPAWTDRILRKGNNLRQTEYAIAPLRFSDHRPVYGLFDCTVSIIDESIREALSRRIFEKRRAEIGGTVVNARTDDTDDEDLIGYDSIEPGLPPASSDRKKWWLENSQPARSTVKAPMRNSIPNPNRPSNPWKYTEEPDWVTVPRTNSNRSESYQSSASVSTSSSGGRTTANNRIVAGSRKLPPPFVASPARKEISIEPSRALTQSLQRQNSVSSTTSQTSNSKTAPPVGKKPSHLVVAKTGSSVHIVSSAGENEGSRGVVKVPVRGRSMAEVQTSFPPPPGSGSESTDGTANSSRSASYHDQNRSIRTQVPPPPPPQPRRGGVTARKAVAADNAEEIAPALPARPMDLLGDDNHDIKGWEALKPL